MYFWLTSVFLCFCEFRGFCWVFGCSFGVVVDYVVVRGWCNTGNCVLCYFLSFLCVSVLLILVFGGLGFLWLFSGFGRFWVLDFVVLYLGFGGFVVCEFLGLLCFRCIL